MRRFEAWLDPLLAREDPPAGIDAEILAALAGSRALDLSGRDTASSEGADRAGAPADALDAYALWGAVTALTHEIKLQGRAFKELNGTLATQAASMADQLRTASREREGDLQRELEHRRDRRLVDASIDLHDRLGRGLESVRMARVTAAASRSRHWLARLLRVPRREQAAVGALVRGYELGIERLEQLLADLYVRQIRCEGQRFDPRRMNAIDRETTSAVPAGTVVEVYRNGFEWNGDLFRPAQVKVAVAPASDEGGKELDE